MDLKVEVGSSANFTFLRAGSTVTNLYEYAILEMMLSCRSPRRQSVLKVEVVGRLALFHINVTS